MPESTFADRLRTLRGRKGLTQSQLAAAVGIHPMTVAKLEGGSRPDPRWSTVLALADALGVPLDEFRPAEKTSKKSR
jgi:transcriptional regulator with XRE-family HTH domain